jgi:nicotinate-nucleotide pyrophosphorylase (carboxylating)
VNRPPLEVIESLKAFLREDIRSGDITTNAMEPLSALAVGTIYAKSRAVLAGIEEVVAIAELSDLKYKILAKEGDWVEPKKAVMSLTGPAKTLLMVERLSLNIVQRMSGIATKTRNMVQAANSGKNRVIVAATRKTTPGFRYFEKRAVVVGGGDPHRYALDDMVLIKNNHIAVVGGVTNAIKAAKKAVSFSKKISCEVRNLPETLEAIAAGADIILLDNFSPAEVKAADTELRKQGLRDKVLLETSGGIDDETIASYAASGVDIVSSGALTHSYKSADFNMLIVLEKKKAK